MAPTGHDFIQIPHPLQIFLLIMGLLFIEMAVNGHAVTHWVQALHLSYSIKAIILSKFPVPVVLFTEESCI